MILFFLLIRALCSEKFMKWLCILNGFYYSLSCSQTWKIHAFTSLQVNQNSKTIYDGDKQSSVTTEQARGQKIHSVPFQKNRWEILTCCVSYFAAVSLFYHNFIKSFLNLSKVVHNFSCMAWKMQKLYLVFYKYHNF